MKVIAYLTSPLLQHSVRSKAKPVNFTGTVKEEDLSAMEPGDVCTFTTILLIFYLKTHVNNSHGWLTMWKWKFVEREEYEDMNTNSYSFIRKTRFVVIFVTSRSRTYLLVNICWQVWSLFNQHGRPNWYAVIKSRTGDRFSPCSHASRNRNVTKLPLKIEM